MLKNLDNIMDTLIKDYSEDQIRNAYTAAVKRETEAKKNAAIVDARSKVLAALTEYFIAVWGKADKNLIKEFENELIAIERKALNKDKVVLDDKERLRRYMDEILGF